MRQDKLYNIAIKADYYRKTLKTSRSDQNPQKNLRRTDNTMVKEKGKMDKKTIYKTLNRKLKIEQHEPQSNTGVYSGALEELSVPAPLVAPIVLP